MHPLLGLVHMAQQVDGHADDQLSHGLVGIIGGVANLHALGAAGFQPHVVDAGKGYVQHFQLIGGQNHLIGVGIIGNGDHLAAHAAANQFSGIGGLFRVVDKFVTGLADRLGQFFDQFRGNADGLQQANTHEKMLPFCIVDFRGVRAAGSDPSSG